MGGEGMKRVTIMMMIPRIWERSEEDHELFKPVMRSSGLDWSRTR
jgi:hypothetical protein